MRRDGADRAMCRDGADQTIGRSLRSKSIVLGPEGCAVKAQTTRQGPQVRRDGADDRSRRRRCRDGANKPFSLSLSLSLSCTLSVGPRLIFAVAVGHRLGGFTACKTERWMAVGCCRDFGSRTRTLLRFVGVIAGSSHAAANQSLGPCKSARPD